MTEGSEWERRDAASAPPSDAAAWAALSAADREHANAFLDQQKKVAIEQEILVRLQAKELAHELQLRRWSIRFGNFSAMMKLTFEIALAFIFLAIAMSIGAIIWTVSHDNSLVIESFSVPPDMANRGLTGQAVAAQLQDRLSLMRDATDSARPANSYTNNWGDDIKVQIPDTGISIGDFYRFLASVLGHQTHITGEVYHTADSIAIAARAGGATGTVVSGAEKDFAKLLQQSAEAIYAQTQPYRYGAFLTGNGPNPTSDKGVSILRRLARTGSKTERAWALVGLGNWQLLIGDFVGALKTETASASLDPTLVGGTDAAWADMLLGHDEGALVWFAKTQQQEWHVDPAAGETMKAYDRGFYDLYSGDYRGAEKAFSEVQALSNYTGFAAIAPAQRAECLAYVHDTAAARAILAEQGWKDDSAIKPLAVASFVDSPPFYAIDAAVGDWSAAVVDLTQVGSSETAKIPIGRQTWLVFDLPRLAYATAMGGDTARAEALITKTPADCYLCVRVRARIAALEKNWKIANYLFAQAVQFAPSIPFAYSEWGETFLRKGDYDSAIAKFREANVKGPHFADPIEMWGEALMQENRSDLALAKFEEATKYAPNWGHLHLEWGKALLYAGRRSEAKQQFVLAAGSELSAADKKALAKASHD